MTEEPHHLGTSTECAFLHNMLALLQLGAGWHRGTTAFFRSVVTSTMSTAWGLFAITCMVTKMLTVVALEVMRPVLLCTKKLTLIGNLVSNEVVGGFSCIEDDDKCGVCFLSLCLVLRSL